MTVLYSTICWQQLLIWWSQIEFTVNTSVNLHMVITQHTNSHLKCSSYTHIHTHTLLNEKRTTTPSKLFWSNCCSNMQIFSKANWENIKTDITEIAKDINNNINSKDINYSWNQLKHGILSTVDQNVPSKMIKKKNHIPWLNRSLKRMLRRKARLHKHAKRTGNFKEYRHFQKECRHFRKAEWEPYK